MSRSSQSKFLHTRLVRRRRDSVRIRKQFPHAVHLRKTVRDVLFRNMALPYPTLIPGLRSPFDQVNGIVYFGRMLDKIRLSAAGKLPEVWEAARGGTKKGSFDWRCCRFLRIDYAALESETLKGEKSDEVNQPKCALKKRRY